MKGFLPRFAAGILLTAGVFASAAPAHAQQALNAWRRVTGDQSEFADFDLPKTLAMLFTEAKPGEELWLRGEELRMLGAGPVRKYGPKAERILNNLSGIRIRLDKPVIEANFYFDKPNEAVELKEAGQDAETLELIRIQVPQTLRLTLHSEADRIRIEGMDQGPEQLVFSLKLPGGSWDVRLAQLMVRYSDLRTRIDATASAFGKLVHLVAEATPDSGKPAVDFHVAESLQQTFFSRPMYFQQEAIRKQRHSSP
jgi:hypothetical protein